MLVKRGCVILGLVVVEATRVTIMKNIDFEFDDHAKQALSMQLDLLLNNTVAHCLNVW